MYLVGVETLAQSSTCRMNIREISASKAAAPKRKPRIMCFSNTENFLTQKEIVLAQNGLCCLPLHEKSGVACNPSCIFLKGSI